jgi:serine protease
MRVYPMQAWDILMMTERRVKAIVIFFVIVKQTTQGINMLISKIGVGGLSLAVLVLATNVPNVANAATQNVRVTWNDNPDKNITVAFAASASGAYLKYGSSTDEASWQTANVTRVGTFGSPVITSQFVQLSQLVANTAYYMQACDSSGCGQRYWFKTAGSSPQNMTFIAGGDSRTNRSVRQQANRMVAKIRPAFVDFGGDLTDSNTSAQMLEWLSDWELSYSTDTINAVTYKYIPGLIVNVGNHEDNDKQFVCKVFGADMDRNGSCSNRDTYGAFNINGSQLRIYNLNSQLRTSAAEHTAQTDWMKADLAAAGAQAQWRMGAYHVPALPRTSAKSAVTAEMFAWGTHFYNLKMNFVFESDSHLLKVTAPVKPSGTSNYVEVAGGTVYLGEGAWGAPLRAADRPAAWLMDLYMGYNFNVLQFVGDQVHVRSVLFTGEAAATAVSRAAREADANALPAAMPIRQIAGADAYVLERDASGRTIKAGSTTANQAPVVNAGVDQSITLPSNASLQATATDDGKPNNSLSYGWTQVSGPGTVTFSAANALASTASFSAAGVYVLRMTVSDSVLSTSDDLNVTVAASGNVTILNNAVTATGISLAKSATKLFAIDVPAGKSSLVIKLSGGSGDGDIYTKFGSAPTTSSYTSKSDGSTNAETITVANPAAGRHYVLLSAYAAVSATSLVATYP